MIGIGHGGAGDLYTDFDYIFDDCVELMKHPISIQVILW